MNRIGVISNRYSDGNAGRSPLAEFAASHPDIVFASPTTVEELPAILQEFARREVSTIVVDGGDGTIREVLSALPGKTGRDWPAIALLPTGKTNLIARDVGAIGRGADGLRTLLDGLRDEPVRETWTWRRSLEVAWPDAPHAKVRGMFLGSGIFVHATRMAKAWAHDRGIKQGPAVALIGGRTLWQCLRGQYETGTRIEMSGRGIAVPEIPCFLFLATTLERLMLGVWPFPECGKGALSWMMAQSPPRRLLRATWAAWRGHLAVDDEKGDYRGGKTRKLSVRLNTPFVVDGEEFAPGAKGVILRAGPAIRFIRA